MRNFLVYSTLALIGIGLVGCSTKPNNASTANTRSAARESATSVPSGQEKTRTMDRRRSTSRVPAFQTDLSSLNSLPPTLRPEEFFGKAKAAYQAVKAIPKTIAQLPCYCECDRGHGHKSLHSCFEDDHASHCAVCVDEALLAYQLEKVEKLKPNQIRERIIAQYSTQQ